METPGDFLNLDVPVAPVPSTKLYFRVQYISEIEWCVVVSPSSYDDIINAGKQNIFL